VYFSAKNPNFFKNILFLNKKNSKNACVISNYLLILQSKLIDFFRLMGKTCVNIGKEIHDELLKQERSVLWLSQQLGCNRTNIYNIFVRESIGTDLLLKISVALNRDFFALYSEAFKKENPVT